MGILGYNLCLSSSQQEIRQLKGTALRCRGREFNQSRCLVRDKVVPWPASPSLGSWHEVYVSIEGELYKQFQARHGVLSTKHQCLAVVCPERLSDKIPDSCELSSRQASSFSAWHQDLDLFFPSAWDFGKFLLVGVHCLDNLLTGSDGTTICFRQFLSDESGSIARDRWERGRWVSSGDLVYGMVSACTNSEFYSCHFLHILTATVKGILVKGNRN